MACKNRIIYSKIGTARTCGTRYYRYLNIINDEVILFFCILLLTHSDIYANLGATKKSI